jgi:hypothetical protein
MDKTTITNKELIAAFNKTHRANALNDAKVLDMAYALCRLYAESFDQALLNAVLGKNLGRYTNAVIELTNGIAVHQFNKELDKYSNAFKMGAKWEAKRDALTNEWETIYTEWAEKLLNTEKPVIQKRDTMTIVKERFVSILKSAEKLDTAEKHELYLLMLEAAEALK